MVSAGSSILQGGPASCVPSPGPWRGWFQRCQVVCWLCPTPLPGWVRTPSVPQPSMPCRP